MFATSALHKVMELWVHLRSESSGDTTIVLTLLDAGEHRKAVNERPDALPRCRVRYATVTVEHSACIRYQHSAFEPRPHAEPPHHGQPRRLR